MATESVVQPAQAPQPVVPPAASPANLPSTKPYPTQSERKVLEEKAKKLIKDIGEHKSVGDEPSMPKRSPKVAGLIVFLMLLVGGGGLAGMQLLNQQQSADLGSQAAYTCDGSITCRLFV
jgi:hypothetical protein